MDRLQKIAYARGALVELLSLYLGHRKLYGGEIPCELLQIYRAELGLIYQRVIGIKSTTTDASGFVEQAAVSLSKITAGACILASTQSIVNSLGAEYDKAQLRRA
jgi:hypothetical protein